MGVGAALSSGLRRHFLRGLLRGLGVAEVVAPDRAQVVVELVDERNAGRDVQLDDLVVRRCCRDTSPARAGCCRARRSARACPTGSPARSSRASRAGSARRCPSAIRSAAARVGVERRVARIVRRDGADRRRQRRRRDVVAAPPDLDLRLAVLRGGLRLVQSLQRAVVPLVQPPALDRPESTADPARRARSTSVRIARFSTDVYATSKT